MPARREPTPKEEEIIRREAHAGKMWAKVMKACLIPDGNGQTETYAEAAETFRLNTPNAASVLIKQGWEEVNRIIAENEEPEPPSESTRRAK